MLNFQQFLFFILVFYKLFLNYTLKKDILFNIKLTNNFNISLQFGYTHYRFYMYCKLLVLTTVFHYLSSNFNNSLPIYASGTKLFHVHHPSLQHYFIQSHNSPLPAVMMRAVLNN